MLCLNKLKFCLGPAWLRCVAFALSGLIASSPVGLQAQSRRIDVSAGVMVGQILTKVIPQYPPVAKAAHVQGTVTLEAVISKQGTIEDLKAISGPPLLQQAAMDAVKQWTYKPYMLNDEPVEVATTINVIFSLGTPETTDPGNAEASQHLSQGSQTVAPQLAAESQTPSCLLGGWRESKAGEQALNGAFAWTFSNSGDALTIRRNDGFVSGTLLPNPEHTAWVGSIAWGEGSVWNNVRLFFASCDLVKTNQGWWFSRGTDPQQAQQIAAQAVYSASSGYPVQQQTAATPQPAADSPAATYNSYATSSDNSATGPSSSADASSTPSDDSVMGEFVNALGQAIANADPNAIQNALNQQLANIQAVAQARAAASQSRTTAPAQAQSQYRFTPVAKDPFPTGPIPSVPPPPPAPPAPGAGSTGPVINVLCPASGFVPGVMRQVASDVSEGVACTPGSVIYSNGIPQYDITCTNAPTWQTGHPPTCPALDGGGGSSAGGGVPASGAGSEVPGVNSCIALTNNSDGTFNYQNTCNFAISFYWTPRTPGPGQFAEQNGTLGPGQSGTSAFAPAGGGYDFYACPAGYLVLGPNKQAITGYVTNYYCVKP